MGKLSDILSSNGGFDDFRKRWNDSEAADEFGPLPPGEYIAHIINGELEQSRSKGTPGYKLQILPQSCTVDCCDSRARD